MRVVSYYSPEYEGEVGDWKTAVRRFGLEYFVEPIPNLGSWRLNCGYKPLFLINMLHKFQEPILWIDIDGRVEAAWDLDNVNANKRYDFAIWFIPNKAMHRNHIPLGPKTGNCGLAAGTMWFNNTVACKRFLALWLAAEHGQGNFEQQVLGEVWYRDRPKELRTLQLHQRYCKVDNARWFEDEPGEVVVGHYQASRRLRRVANENGQKRVLRDIREREKQRVRKRQVVGAPVGPNADAGVRHRTVDLGAPDAAEHL